MRLFFIAFLFLIPFSVSADMYRCNINGEMTFTDKPCTNEIERKNGVIEKRQTSRRGAGTNETLADLDFSGSDDKNLNVALAAFEFIRNTGRDCKIKLDVYGVHLKSVDACQLFLQQINEGSQWEQAKIETKRLGQSDDFMRRRFTDIKKVLRYNNQIEQYSAQVMMALQ